MFLSGRPGGKARSIQENHAIDPLFSGRGLPRPYERTPKHRTLMKNIVYPASCIILATALALVVGCTSPQAPWYGKGPTEKEPEVAEAERLFEQGYLRSFIVASVTPFFRAAACRAPMNEHRNTARL